MNENKLENLLQSLPKFTRSETSNQAFHKKLALLSEQETSSPGAAVGVLQNKFFFNWFFWRRFAFAGAFAVLALLAVGTVAAYRPSVTRGTFLYPWKQASERVELALAFSPLQEVKTHVRFSDRRLMEAENILRNNPLTAFLIPVARANEDEIYVGSDEIVWLTLTLEDMRREIEFASVIVETRMEDADSIEQALEKIERSVEKHIEKLSDFGTRRINVDRVKELLEKTALQENKHRAALMEAKKNVQEAKERKETKMKVRLMRQQEKREEREERQEDRAEQREENRENRTERYEELREDRKEQLGKKSENRSEETGQEPLQTEEQVKTEEVERARGGPDRQEKSRDFTKELKKKAIEGL